MKTGPKERAPIDRIRPLIAGFDEAALVSYHGFDLTGGGDCWIWMGNAARKVWIAGSTKPVQRVLVEYACGEPLSDAYRLKQDCRNARCVNPRHFDIIPTRMNFYETPPPTPAKIGGLVGGDLQIFSDDIDELHSVIQSREPRPTLAQWKEELRALRATGIEYAEADIEAAYARIS